MQTSTQNGLMSIISAAPLIKKIRINKAVFPLEKVLFELINFAISLIAVALVMIYFQVPPTFNVLLLPLLLFYMVLFCAGLSFLLSALAVFFRDVIHLWSVFTLAWTYATPLFYPVSILPDWMFRIMQFNPMYQYVDYFRDIVLYGQLPSLDYNSWHIGFIGFNLICFGMGIITFLVGLFVFRKTQKKFILYV
jgi:ABC-2 type transport system permease protein